MNLYSPHIEKPRARKAPIGAALIADQGVSRALVKKCLPLEVIWRCSEPAYHFGAIEQPVSLHEDAHGKKLDNGRCGMGEVGVVDLPKSTCGISIALGLFSNCKDFRCLAVDLAGGQMYGSGVSRTTA